MRVNKETCSGKAVRTPDALRLSAAMKRQQLKGMSVATPGSGCHYKAHLPVRFIFLISTKR
nr:MAG TPA: hypothetical protein [Caudoviricetes sp.]